MYGSGSRITKTDNTTNLKSKLHQLRKEKSKFDEKLKLINKT